MTHAADFEELEQLLAFQPITYINGTVIVVSPIFEGKLPNPTNGVGLEGQPANPSSLPPLPWRHGVVLKPKTRVERYDAWTNFQRDF